MPVPLFRHTLIFHKSIIMMSYVFFVDVFENVPEFLEHFTFFSQPHTHIIICVRFPKKVKCVMFSGTPYLNVRRGCGSSYFGLLFLAQYLTHRRTSWIRYLWYFRGFIYSEDIPVVSRGHGNLMVRWYTNIPLFWYIDKAAMFIPLYLVWPAIPAFLGVSFFVSFIYFLIGVKKRDIISVLPWEYYWVVCLFFLTQKQNRDNTLCIWPWVFIFGVYLFWNMCSADSWGGV